MIRKLTHFIGSNKFFYLIVVVFTLEASWVALTARYPQAFDENFHFGLIQLYAKHWLPFFDSQPPDAGVYGAVARDPSYLYHYLMSFPYRVLTHIVSSQSTQIIALRFINVALAASSLFVYARLLKQTSLGGAYRNAILFFFTAIPVFPILAGQISYDNLILPLIGTILLMTIIFIRNLQNNLFKGPLLANIILVGLITSLVKYAVLPLLLGVAIYVASGLFMYIRCNPGRLGEYVPRIRHMRRLSVALYLVAFLVVGTLFTQRYGVNVVRYHTPVPNCAQVISVDECIEYAPWGRDYQFARDNVAWQRDGLWRYSNTWIRQMMNEFFFSVYSLPRANTNIVDYWGAPPVSWLINTGWIVLSAGVALSLVFASRLWRSVVVRLFVIVTVLYVGALFADNYHSYLVTAIPVSIHGRYVLPLIPLVLVLFCLAGREALWFVSKHASSVRSLLSGVKISIFVVLALLCTQGGGIITDIVRSSEENFWPQSSLAQKANTNAKRKLKEVVIE